MIRTPAGPVRGGSERGEEEDDKVSEKQQGLGSRPQLPSEQVEGVLRQDTKDEPQGGSEEILPRDRAKAGAEIDRPRRRREEIREEVRDEVCDEEGDEIS